MARANRTKPKAKKKSSHGSKRSTRITKAEMAAVVLEAIMNDDLRGTKLIQLVSKRTGLSVQTVIRLISELTDSK